MERANLPTTGLGAKGIDYISSVASGVTTTGFPIYDAHGNMTACLFRAGSMSFSLSNQRSYDAGDLLGEMLACSMDQMDT